MAAGATGCALFERGGSPLPWPVKENGNEHFAAIFLDESRSAGLHLCKDCHRLVFAQGCVPIPLASLRQGASVQWGILNARMKGLSGSVEDGRFVIAATAREMFFDASRTPDSQ